MKITVSYINSKENIENTIKKIEASSADAIHIDLMDGEYVSDNNINIGALTNIFKDTLKPLDVHLMVMDATIYLDTLYKLNTDIIFIHPFTNINAKEVIEDIVKHKKKAGIVINPDDNIKAFLPLLPLVDAVLIMSVTPGLGGQRFKRESLVNYELVKDYKSHFHFLLYVDGGINDETINFVKEADGVIVGSYICMADDYEKQIQELKYQL